jgi:recombination protein RecA
MATISKEKQKKLDEAMGKINKKFGAGTVSTATQAADKLARRIIKTPSLEFNNMLYGGIGNIVELYGPESSGKTSMAIETLALNQRDNPEFIGAWLETEGSVTKEILESHGVDLSRLIYWDQQDAGNAENALDICRSLVTSGSIDMMVVNSIAGLAPKVETEDDLEKQNIALVARLLSKFFRVITGVAKKNNVTMIFINQVRDKVGVMFGNPETTGGGKALAFYASIRVRMNRLKIDASDPIKDTEGVKIGCIAKKNRFAGMGNPFTKCEYYARFDTGIDSIIIIPELLDNAGIVRKAGAWWYYEDANGKPIIIDGIECKFKSKNDFIDNLRASDVLRETFVNLLDGKTVTSVSDEELEEINKENMAIESEMAAIEEEDSANDGFDAEE